MATITEVLERPANATGLWSWITTVDHKRIGILYGVTAFIFFLVAGVEAGIIRMQLAVPENGLVSPDVYNQMFTMHATAMIFMAIMPLSAAFFNFIIPLAIGARDVAFPRLNAFSYWSFLFGALLIHSSFLFQQAPDAGWFSYAPLTEEPYSLGKGIDFWALDWAKENLWKKVDVVSDEEFKNACSDFYYKKTIARINKFYDSTHTLDQIETINGMTTPTITEMIKAINKDWICKPEQTGFHGDFILDNIILGEDGFTLLDWRQNFGGLIECGDMYYDLAKLNHNLVVNHEIVNNDLFTVKKINGEVVADIHRRQSLIECQEVYHNWILENGYDLNKVKVLTSLIWLNMSALHHHPFDEFLYYYGKYTLLKTLGELENEYTPTYELQSSNRVAQVL